MPRTKRPTFEEELRNLINRYSLENGSNTPDYMLAEYLSACLKNLDVVIKARDKWYKKDKSEENTLLMKNPLDNQ